MGLLEDLNNYSIDYNRRIRGLPSEKQKAALAEAELLGATRPGLMPPEAMTDPEAKLKYLERSRKELEPFSTPGNPLYGGLSEFMAEQQKAELEEQYKQKRMQEIELGINFKDLPDDIALKYVNEAHELAGHPLLRQDANIKEAKKSLAAILKAPPSLQDEMIDAHNARFAGSTSKDIQAQIDQVEKAREELLKPMTELGKLYTDRERAAKSGARQEVLDAYDNLITKKTKEKSESEKPLSGLGKLISDKNAAIESSASKEIIDTFDAAIKGYREGSNIYIGTDESGRPIFAQSKGRPSPSPVDIEGGGPLHPKPTDMSALDAGRLELVKQAAKEVRDVKASLIKNGKVDRSLLFNTNVPFGGTPFSEGRKVNSRLMDAIEAKLRAETGAAAPEEEVKRIAERFRPSILDDDANVIDKLNRLEEFVSGVGKTMDPQNRFGGNPGKKDLSKMSDEELLKALGTK